MMKWVPDVDEKELAFAARRPTGDEDVALLPDQLVAGSAQAAPAKDAKVMRFFMLRLEMKLRSSRDVNCYVKSAKYEKERLLERKAWIDEQNQSSNS